VGDRAFKLLVDGLGSPRAVLEADPAARVEACGVSPQLTAAIQQTDDRWDRAHAAVERTLAAGFSLIPYGSAAYPRLLEEIADPPAILYVAGSLFSADEVTVALVGSRRASSHGVRFARKLAQDLASSGVTVVSGLAQGIDAAGHEGALDAGGRTVAVFGAGLDVIYPGRHAELARGVRASGAWVSELPLGSEPLARHFPRRNRIISGLSLGVVVVEASEKSGSLITASSALDQGREVFAVPGLPGSYSSRGANQLLRVGAKLVEGAADVLAELPPLPDPRPVPAAAKQEPPSRLRALWEALEDAPLHIDELAARAGVSASEAAAGFMELSLGGHADEWPGKRYARSRPT
jgi:DNA processing protein